MRSRNRDVISWVALEWFSVFLMLLWLGYLGRFRGERRQPIFKVNLLALARMSFWAFKNGKREVFSELDKLLNTLSQNSEGFREYMSLISHDNPNTVTILTLWQDDDALK